MVRVGNGVRVRRVDLRAVRVRDRVRVRNELGIGLRLGLGIGPGSATPTLELRAALYLPYISPDLGAARRALPLATARRAHLG